jgi:hypothetical protein
MAKGPKSVELGRGTYRAAQTGNELLLIASGIHPTTGFRELFEARDLSARPPEFAFFFIKPTGITLSVVTPFQHHDRFEVNGKVDFVMIADADGEHRIKVGQMTADASDDPEVRVLKANRALLAAAPLTSAQCRACVRQVVTQWSGNDDFSNDQTLGDILTTGPCSVGAIAELAQSLGASCAEPPDSISCDMTVRQLLDLTC